MTTTVKTKDVVFTMRMDETTKTKLEDLAKGNSFKFNNSAVVRFLIHAEHSKKSIN